MCRVSLTLSPPVRVAALVGALVLTGLAAVAFLLGRGVLGGDASSPSASPTAPLVTPAPSGTPTPAHTPVRPKPARVPSGFPAKIDRALQDSRVVVVSVSVPGSAVDAIVRREARSGARAARASFVTYSAANEREMTALLAKTGVLPAPAVVIVKRPGVVASTFSVTDADTIAQAVAQARG